MEVEHDGIASYRDKTHYVASVYLPPLAFRDLGNNEVDIDNHFNSKRQKKINCEKEGKKELMKE